MTPRPVDLPAHTELSLLIVFADLTRFTAETQRRPDREVARIMDAFYERVAARIEASSGRVVKFIGDAALIVFPEDGAERGIVSLLDLKEDIDAFFAALGWECRINAGRARMQDGCRRQSTCGPRREVRMS